MTKKLTQEEFIVRANKVHGEGRYDYSQTHYVSMRQDVTIKCNICGNIFKQNPNHHLRGAGCFECAKKRMGDRMTQEEFIEKARKVHGDKFDYSMVHYTHCRMPITIKCNVCGTIFEQPPANHLNSNGGCPTCRKKAISRAITHEEFVRRATEIHKGKYDYSQSVYRGWDKDIEIRCPEHGLFVQKAGSHISGSEGCPECLKVKMSKANTLSVEQFIKKARKVHGNKYGYDKVDYKSTYDKVIITCPIHGDFEQTPSSHLAGNGCYWCGRESQSKKIKHSQEEFIRMANEVHNGKYSYEKTVYQGTTKDVVITCPIHGDFEQNAGVHLQGHGCPDCGQESWHSQMVSNTEDFIERAREMHGNEYDYSLVKYVNQMTKVKIICKKHGVFEQTPHSHLHWQGCPKCSSSIGERRIMRYLEKHSVKYIHHYRVPYKKPPIKSHFEIDFYLPDHGLFIEYNGQQHYKHIAYWKHDNPLPHRQARDAALRKYCEDREDIRLLEIPYTDFDRIEEILDREL